MHLQLPSIEVKHEEEFDAGDDYSDLPEEEQSEAWDKAYQAWQDSAVETLVHHTLLVSVLDDRLLIAHNYLAEEEDAAAATAEQLSDVFSQWIDAHASGAGGFARRLVDEPGAARVMSLEGLPVFELAGDVTPLIALLRAKSLEDAKAEVEQAIRMFGLDSLGPFAIRSTVQGSLWRTQLSLAAHAPRQGLLRLLDQEPLAADPPQWVPASVVRYSQWSFDLGKAYETVKESVLREFPDQAAASFEMAETQVQNFARASLPEVLESLGNRHIILSFGFGSDDSAEGHEDAEERLAVVWQLEDEDVWSRLLKAVAPFASMAPGTEYVEEQGFNGWRMTSEVFEGGLFLGKGYLVLAYGSGVVESMLSSLNNPPTGSDALRGSEVFATANTMIDLESSLGFEITDGDRTLRMVHGFLERQLDQMEMMSEYSDDSDAQQFFLTLARALMPEKIEIEGMMGVIASRWEVNDDGVFASTVQELPR